MGVKFHKARNDQERIMAIVGEQLKRDGFTEAKPIPKKVIEEMRGLPKENKGIWNKIKETFKRIWGSNG